MIWLIRKKHCILAICSLYKKDIESFTKIRLAIDFYLYTFQN